MLKWTTCVQSYPQRVLRGGRPSTSRRKAEKGQPVVSGEEEAPRRLTMATMRPERTLLKE
jgi:hypothetical protein